MEMKCGPLTFFSNFDSGNLARVERVKRDLTDVEDSQSSTTTSTTTTPQQEQTSSGSTSANDTAFPNCPTPDFEYNLWTAPDCSGTEYENGNRTWFYFGVRGCPPGKLLKLTLMNMNKQGKLYNQGMNTFVKVVPCRNKWERIRERPVYEVIDGNFRLSFLYRFPEQKNVVCYFAFCYPYSYAETQDHLRELDRKFEKCDETKRDEENSIYYHRELFCYSLDKLRVDLITVTSRKGMLPQTELRFDGLFPDEDTVRARQFQGKKVFLLTSRVHPGETPSSFVFRGFLNFITHEDDPRATALRDSFVFKLVPLLNPDGVKRGHYRTDPRGVNLNRVYHNPSLELHPAVYAVKTLVGYYQGLYKESGTSEDIGGERGMEDEKLSSVTRSEAAAVVGQPTQRYTSCDIPNLASTESDETNAIKDEKGCNEVKTVKCLGELTNIKLEYAKHSDDVSTREIDDKKSSNEFATNVVENEKCSNEYTGVKKEHDMSVANDGLARCDNSLPKMDIKLYAGEYCSFTDGNGLGTTTRNGSLNNTEQDKVFASASSKNMVASSQVVEDGTSFDCSTTNRTELKGDGIERGERISNKDNEGVMTDGCAMMVGREGSMVANEKNSMVVNEKSMVVNQGCMVANGKNNMVVNEKNMVANEKNMVVNQGSMVINRESMVPNQGSMVDNKDSMVPNGGSMVSNQGSVVPNQGSMVINQERMVPNQGSMVDNKASMVPTQGSMVDNQSSMVDNKESMVPNGGRMVSDLGSMVPNQGSTVVNEASMVDTSGTSDLKSPWLGEAMLFYVDLHSHASKRGCFMYGNFMEDEEQYVHCLLFPKLISINSAHFDFTACNFTERNMYSRDRRDGMSKEGSGRVAMYKMTGLPHCYTLECNYNCGRSTNAVPQATCDGGRATPPPPPGFPPRYTMDIYEEVGRAVAISALDMIKLNTWSRLPNSEYGCLEGVKSCLYRYLRNPSKLGPAVQRRTTKNNGKSLSVIPSSLSTIRRSSMPKLPATNNQIVSVQNDSHATSQINKNADKTGRVKQQRLSIQNLPSRRILATNLTTRNQGIAKSKEQERKRLDLTKTAPLLLVSNNKGEEKSVDDTTIEKQQSNVMNFERHKSNVIKKLRDNLSTMQRIGNHEEEADDSRKNSLRNIVAVKQLECTSTTNSTVSKTQFDSNSKQDKTKVTVCDNKIKPIITRRRRTKKIIQKETNMTSHDVVDVTTIP